MLVPEPVQSTPNLLTKVEGLTRSERAPCSGQRPCIGVKGTQREKDPTITVVAL